MYSAQEIIAMRANGFRAHWIMVTAFTLLVCAGFLWVGEYLLFALTFAITTIPSVVKAYKKERPVAASSDGLIGDGGDFGAD